VTLAGALARSATGHVPAAFGVAAGGALDLHKGICDPQLEKCSRWPEDFRLWNVANGDLVRGRCRCTNLCRYCQTLYVVETVEMLTLDAMEHAPTIWAVLTAREHLTRKDTYGHLRQLRKATRKRWPDIEWFVQVEFQRRRALHLNLLIKGVPNSDLDELAQLLTERWCARVDAEPAGQWFELIEDAGHAVKYLAKMLAHGLKAEQAPPLGWKGHRTSQTLGYLVRPASVMRLEARRALQEKRELWKLLQESPDVDAWTAEEVITDRLANSGTWQLVSIKPSTLHNGCAGGPRASGGGRGLSTPPPAPPDIPSTETLGRPLAGP
jgi:hypothetical protein